MSIRGGRFLGCGAPRPIFETVVPFPRSQELWNGDICMSPYQHFPARVDRRLSQSHLHRSMTQNHSQHVCRYIGVPAASGRPIQDFFCPAGLEFPCGQEDHRPRDCCSHARVRFRSKGNPSSASAPVNDFVLYGNSLSRPRALFVPGSL